MQLSCVTDPASVVLLMQLQGEGGQPAGYGGPVEPQQPVAGIAHIPAQSPPPSPLGTLAPVLLREGLVLMGLMATLTEVLAEGAAAGGADRVLLQPGAQTPPGATWSG